MSKGEQLLMRRVPETCKRLVAPGRPAGPAPSEGAKSTTVHVTVAAETTEGTGAC